MEIKLATSRERAGAAFVNLIVGCLPLTVPGLLSHYLQSFGWWESLHSLFIGLLALVQVLWVHENQGSPGAVLVGLQVRGVGSQETTVMSTMWRSMPYLAIVAALIAKREIEEGAVIAVVASATYYLSIGFICISGMYAFLGGGRSILDLLSRSEVIRIHNIRAPMKGV